MRADSCEQARLDSPIIAELPIDMSCRDELVPISLALQYLHADSDLFAQWVAIITDAIQSSGRDADEDLVSLECGRVGLSAWSIGVLAALRLGLDVDYDRLQDLTSHHRVVRGLLGLGDWSDEGWSHRRIRHNLAVLDAAALRKLNGVLLTAGHQVLGVDSCHHIRIDSFVVETNTHYPSDSAQLMDGIRKLLQIGNKICKECGLSLFRQHAATQRKAKQALRAVGTALKRRGEQREASLRQAYTDMLTLAEHVCNMGLQLWDHISELRNTGAISPSSDDRIAYLVGQLNYFMTGTAHVAHIAKLRVLEGETVPQEERLYSLFEPHAELINRGKTPHPYQMGHRCYVAEDEYGFIVDYDVMENGQQDVDVLPSILKRLTAERAEDDPLHVISCDRGFHSPNNQKEIAQACEHPNLHPKGNPQYTQQWIEDTDHYRTARNRHAGIESCIGALVHANGLKRCRDRGLERYHAYVGLGVMGRNLTTLGRHLIKKNAPECAADLSKRLPPLAA